MSMTHKFLAMYAFIAFSFFLFGVQTPFTQVLSGVGTCEKTLDGELVCDDQTLLDSVLAIVSPLALSGWAAAIIASAVFVPQALIYVIVAPALMFVISFFTFPAAMFNAAGLGDESFEQFPVIQAVFTIFNFFFAFAVVSWLKGND